MTTFILAAITADGFIAKNESHAALWTSKEDKKRLVELTKRAGVVVMGSTTYKTLPRPLKERVNIVYSRDKQFEGAETTQKNPHELIQELEGRGFKEVAILGGSHIYTLFLKAQAVDHIYLTIEPILFGTGIKLFNEELNTQLVLEEMVKTDTGSLLLKYKVNYTGATAE